jgi:glycosyltransferase involved in cell wall biosynthesis
VANLDLRRIDAVVALSPWHARCLGELYGPELAAKTRTICNCADDATIGELLSRKVKKEPLSFVWVSCPERGLADVVANFHRIRSMHPTAVLHVYRKAMRMSAPPYVVFHGYKPNREILAAMARADYWLYPTDFLESSCIAAMEAQRMGCVCIATRLGALQTTLGPDTLFLEPDAEPDADRWAQILERVAYCEGRPAEKERIREAGRDWAARFSCATVAAQWAELVGLPKLPNEIKIRGAQK